MTTETTPVIFRKFNDDGSILAIFPTIDWDGIHVSSYQLIGQHGACSLSLAYQGTKPASEAEYAPLKRELEALGYVLDVRQRLTKALRSQLKLARTLERLRQSLRLESISYGELHELQCLGEQGLIPEDDLELREAAGLPELPESGD